MRRAWPGGLWALPALAVARALPAYGFGLWLRLGAATLCVLLPGILVGQHGRRFELTGDESLRSRPMERVAAPLRQMGAAIDTTDGRLPMAIDAGPLRPIRCAGCPP